MFSNAVLGLDINQLIVTGVGNIVGAVHALALEGATNFLIPNMPDLGKTPGFLGDLSLTGLSAAFNAALAESLTMLAQGMNTVDITLFDTFGTLNTIIANPSAYGFTNVTDQCVMNLATCDPDTWLFWDSVHPTTAGHAILGKQFAQAIPEPGSLWLAALALLLVAFTWQARQRRFTSLTAAPGVAI